MIVISDITAADIGRWVVYRYLDKQLLGRIKRWNQNRVFVVY